nr:putative glucuronoxylan glucuronosyltransferase f8h [Ipomoea batatas]GME08573.1 putative glucuronoxylan glucuronosyltransferase f8h [Ipomoea batatas]GME08574.1 putative glucuronoxylan glucuronosyltransferase f8h [Ipomoea batatas]GME18577.1 putative glucuronoxylan glucuronosyltransferase f8h [Ipomoea batatas]
MQSSYSNLSMVTDWTKGDPDVFTTNTSKPGWCNVGPDEASASKRSAIVSMMDLGADSVSSTCINQCSGHSLCRGGFCQCSLCSVLHWRLAKVNILLSKLFVNIEAVVEKRRPLIDVYDLPPEYNSLLLEGRHFKLECVNRIYDPNNATIWRDMLAVWCTVQGSSRLLTSGSPKKACGIS